MKNEEIQELVNLALKQKQYKNKTISRSVYSAAVDEFAKRFGYKPDYVRQLIRERKKTFSHPVVSEPPPPQGEVKNTLKELFSSLIDDELVAPGGGMSLSFKGRDFVISKEDLEDIIMCITNSYNRYVYSSELKLKLNRFGLREAMISQLIDEQVNMVKKSYTPDALYKLCLSLRALQGNMFKMSPEFSTVLNICHEFKPDITVEEIKELIKKHS